MDKGIKFSKVVGLNVFGLKTMHMHIHEVMGGTISTKPDGKKYERKLQVQKRRNVKVNKCYELLQLVRGGCRLTLSVHTNM